MRQPHFAGSKSLRYALIGSLAATLLAIICFRIHIDFASVIPLYVLLVVLQSLTGDFRSSAIVAFVSTACLDLFFTEPLFSLRIDHPLNALALAAFVLTSLVITRLVSRVREEAKSAKLQKERLNRLYQLAQQLLSLDPEAPLGEDFLEPFRRLFRIRAVCVFEADSAELHLIGDSRNELAAKTRDAYIRGLDVDDPDAQVSVRRLQAGRQMAGSIGFEGLQDQEETAGALTALTAALLERKIAFHTASVAAAAAQTEIYRSAILDALAHEFKTPLATILAAAGGLREAGPLAAEQEAMADTVENEASRLGNLTSRLLRTARLDNEEIRPRLELIDITSVVAHMSRQYSVRSSDRAIFLTNRYQLVQALADPELIRLIVSQLLENACKYSQPGSIVTIGVERQGDFVAIRVSNNGSSIPRNEQHRIFDRFYRGADAKRSTSGSGLGLYVARKIAVAHGGALELEIEEPSDGVTFCLKLPATKDELQHVLTAK
jgi:two-component system, OmpR family, sensor histidine kinase KdpD